jgi:HK97 family phage prohead protease
MDRIRDQFLPGAFADSLSEIKSLGRRVPMHLNHGIPELVGQRGIGIFPSIVENDGGIAVEGKISGMNTDGGRLLYERVKDGAIGGLSVGFTVRGNGATYGKSAGEPRRTIKAANLHEISLVDTPAHTDARVLHIKSMALGRDADAMRAVLEIKSRVQAGDMPKLRELQDAMRDAFGFSNSQAEKVANLGLKALTRESDGLGDASPEVKALLGELLSGAKHLHSPNPN